MKTRTQVLEEVQERIKQHIYVVESPIAPQHLRKRSIEELLFLQDVEAALSGRLAF